MYHPHLHVNNNKRVSDDFLFGSELNEFPDNDVHFYEERNRMGFEVEDGGMESTSTLFEKVVPVRVTKCNSEDRHMDLTARFVMGLSKVHRATKVLRVQITNELDPFFLYSLEVNEDDFQSLKVDQCLLVDFATFPYKFIELLEQCIISSSDEKPRGMGRFLAVLHIRTGDSTFTVVETNQFKHLSHLSLVFRQGNDSVIKQFLAGRLAEYKSINSDMHEKLRRTLHSLEKALRDVNNLSSELAEVKENQCRNISELKAEFTLELAHEKEKMMLETAELKDRLERDRSELETHLRQQVNQQQERACDLDKQVRSLLDTKYTLENRITEMKTKLSSVEKELEEKLQEGDRLRKDNRNLEMQKQEAAKQQNDHLIRLSALEQEVSDKNELLSNLTKQHEAQASHRIALEASWKEAQTAADRAEERASASATELTKCYQIIEKLQVELRASKQKVKLKGQVASQQDNLLSERQAAIEKAQGENHTLRSELANLKADQESSKKKTEEVTTKLEEAQNMLQSNQQMIQWLNQQLTEAQLGKLPGSAPTSRYNTFTRSNANGLCFSSCLTSNRPGEANTPLSSHSSLGGNSGSTAFKSQFPMSSPYLSTTATQFSGIPAIQVKHQQNGLGVFNPNPTMTGSQRSMYVPGTKAALCATQKVHYKPKAGVTVPSAMAGSSNLSSYTGNTMPLDGTTLLNSWNDSGSWGTKHNALPQPQLSFADRSGYGSLIKSPITIGRPGGSLTTSDGCHMHPQSPNQQSPSGRQSPSMMQAAAAGDQIRSELSRSSRAQVEAAGFSVQDHHQNGDSSSQTAGDGGSLQSHLNRPQSPKPYGACSESPPPQQQQHSSSHTIKGHGGDRENNLSPSRTKATLNLKTPSNRSPQNSHFSRR